MRVIELLPAVVGCWPVEDERLTTWGVSSRADPTLTAALAAGGFALHVVGFTIDDFVRLADLRRLHSPTPADVFPFTAVGRPGVYLPDAFVLLGAT